MSFDNGLAPSVQSANIDEAKVPRSSFNMSRVVNTNGIIGAIIPFDILETLPNEDYNISYDILALTRNPLVRRLQNGFTIYIHTYWCAKKDLWKGFKNYYDKGRSGTHVASVPKYYPSCSSTGKTKDLSNFPLDKDTGDYTFFTPFSPLGYMGVPTVAIDTDETNVNAWFKPTQLKSDESNKVNEGYVADGNETKFGINAMPLVMYNKIYRDFEANENILGQNNAWYHENDDEDLILPYDCGEWVNTANGELLDYNTTELANENGAYYVPKGKVEDGDIKEPFLNMLHFGQFKGDYFTTANIFKDLIRGSADLINENLTNIKFAGDSSDFIQDSQLREYVTVLGSDEEEGKLATFTYAGGHWDTEHNQLKAWERMASKLKATGISLNNIRKAIVLEKLMQRNATTNGNYRELVGASFGYYPKDPNRRPTYIGGTYQPIVFNEVVQTSATGDTPLGTTGSRGMSANAGYIGKFHSDDFGYIMSVLKIVPDTYYSTQALEPLWQRTEQDMEYNPILNNLEPEAVKNKELFISGSAEYDEDVWGYVNRFENMKSRRNIISGLGALGDKAIFDSSTFMKRMFTKSDKPNLNNDFITMSIKNIDMTPFTSKNEPPFDLMIGCNIDKVSPMPYKAEPCDMGIKY